MTKLSIHLKLCTGADQIMVVDVIVVYLCPDLAEMISFSWKITELAVLILCSNGMAFVQKSFN